MPTNSIPHQYPPPPPPHTHPLDPPATGESTIDNMEPHRGLHTIGELAKRTGLSVKTIRFYADTHVVPPTTRSPNGYRLYDADAAARLDLVRTLRELGIDLSTIRRILNRDADLGHVAAAHAEALGAQIRMLRLRRAVLQTLAHRNPTPRDVTLMNKLANLSAEERQRILDDYHDAIFDGLDLDPTFVTKMRSIRVDLPDNPTPDQVDAWVELAELVSDPTFRTRVREMTEQQAHERANGTFQPPHTGATDLATRVIDTVTPALNDGTDPTSPHGQTIVTELATAFAHHHNTPDTPHYRADLADQLATFTDTRVERYYHLIAVINDWPTPTPQVPAWEWFITGLRATPTH
ncbi:MerR family transcriptional regulator [Salinactinospora qingdaonensis]|uniref:MerR family transcriptional regulator n=2 Tax=Salinactinospora qingdaonensis TaxID=702744 RepID=A0ABP7FJ40_9ACTN